MWEVKFLKFSSKYVVDYRIKICYIVVKLFEVMETERNLFLVMEYACRGKQS